VDKKIAEDVLRLTEKETQEEGSIGYDTAMVIKAVVDRLGDGKNYLDYLYMAGVNQLAFNADKWRRHFLDGE
jgi:hypothetical protein